MLPCTANFCKQRYTTVLPLLFSFLLPPTIVFLQSQRLSRLSHSPPPPPPPHRWSHSVFWSNGSNPSSAHLKRSSAAVSPKFWEFWLKPDAGLTYEWCSAVTLVMWLPSYNIFPFLDDDLYTWGAHQSVIRQLIIPRNNVLFKRTLSICPLAPPPRIYFRTMEMLPGWFLFRKYSLWQFHQCRVKK